MTTILLIGGAFAMVLFVVAVCMPPRPRCGFLLSTGDRCEHGPGHDGPHLTHIGGAYGQRFEWPAESELVHRIRRVQ